MLQTLLILATLVLAILSVEIRDLLHAVLYLSGMCITIGSLFGLLNAPYVMFFQFLIYAGVTLVLFAAVLMLTERSKD
jgi:NADH:ubiquinone oxidoreductase subunit 6 (subunit J)